MELQRILVASRGEIARRLIRYYKGLGIETVAVFSEADVEQPWVEEADYPVYLNGKTVAETYMHPQRIVSAALDAGCDAIHPGYCFLAERVDFIQYALNANMGVIGNEPRALWRAVDRFELRKHAREVGIPLVPASEPLDEKDDGVATGAQLGLPLFVKAVGGGVIRRVARLEDLPAAVAAVRDAAGLVTGERTVYLERAVDKLRSVGTTVVGDRHGNAVHLGESDSSLQYQFHTWVEETGKDLVPHEVSAKLGPAAAELARKIGWVGVGRVRWAVTPHEGWYLLGFSGRLTTGYTLTEQVLSVDLIDVQHRVTLGEPVGWSQDDVKIERYGVQLRVLPVDPTRPDADVDSHIERLVLPEGEHVLSETGTKEGQPCNSNTDPLLAKITVTGPTRHATLVRARAALEDLVIEGVPTNRDFLMRLLADESVWRGDYDTDTIERTLSGGST